MSIDKSDKLLIDQLRNRIKDVLTEFYDNDFNLYRWLTGYNRDLGHAEEAIRKCLELRKLLQLDVPEDQLFMHPVVKNFYKIYFMETTSEKEDYKTKVFAITLDGIVDIGGLYACMSVTDYLLSNITMLEWEFRAILKKEREVGKQCKACIILDLNGLTYDKWLWYAVKGSQSTLFRIMSECYAEGLHTVFIIRAGIKIQTVWKLISAILPAKTTSKVKILGSNWKSKLQEEIPMDCLPETYGGHLKIDLLEEQLQLSKLMVPESLYYDYKANAPDPAKVKEFSLGRGCHHILSFHVEHTDLKLCWWLKTESTYKMAVLRTDSELTSEQKSKRFKQFSPNHCGAEFIYPELQLCSEFVPDVNSVNCDKRGWYHVQFVNENWLMSLTMKYVVEVKNV